MRSSLPTLEQNLLTPEFSRYNLLLGETFWKYYQRVCWRNKECEEFSRWRTIVRKSPNVTHIQVFGSKSARVTGLGWEDQPTPIGSECATNHVKFPSPSFIWGTCVSPFTNLNKWLSELLLHGSNSCRSNCYYLKKNTVGRNVNCKVLFRTFCFEVSYYK